MSSVFLCHNSKDKLFVRELAERLKLDGVRVWLDEAELNIGDSLINRISGGIKDMDYVAVIISKNSIDSSWVQKEISLAMSKEIAGREVSVLPILVDKCSLPETLADKLYADFTLRENYEDEYSKLLRAMDVASTSKAKSQDQNRLTQNMSISDDTEQNQTADVHIVGIDTNCTQQDKESRMYESDRWRKTGLAAKFEQFRQNIELTKNQRDRIVNSHTHLRQNNLRTLSYIDDAFLTGSYKRHTMIKPPNDVDLFVVINHSHHEITPNAVLKKLKRDLSDFYPNSVVRQDKPCIVLDFNHCAFELTPAIKINQYLGFSYYIPSQGGNTWMQVEDPRNLEQQLSHANRSLSGMLTPLIKMMKVCKRQNNLKGKKSFELENLAINSLQYIDNYRGGVQELLKAYDWIDYSQSCSIEAMTDEKFASYCRSTLFGMDFPE